MFRKEATRREKVPFNISIDEEPKGRRGEPGSRKNKDLSILFICIAMELEDVGLSSHAHMNRDLRSGKENSAKKKGSFPSSN